MVLPFTVVIIHICDMCQIDLAELLNTITKATDHSWQVGGLRYVGTLTDLTLNNFNNYVN